jgi:hypothetical protein
MMAVTASAAADSAKESMAVRAGRNYVKLLFESKAPPFVSEKQPVQVRIVAGNDACAEIGSLRATKPEQMRQVKTCALSLQKRFQDKVDDVAFDDVKPATFIASRPKHERAATKKLVSGLGISRTAFDIDGETLEIHLAVAKDGRIHAIWLDVDAVE